MLSNPPSIKTNLLALQQKLVDSGVSVTPVPVTFGWELTLVGGELVLAHATATSITIETADARQMLKMAAKIRGLMVQIPEAP